MNIIHFSSSIIITEIPSSVARREYLVTTSRNPTRERSTVSAAVAGFTRPLPPSSQIRSQPLLQYPVLSAEDSNSSHF